jgi:ribosomal protein L40E
MEEQVITQKQYKTIKSTYGMLKAAFVISIIMFFFELIANLFNLKQGIVPILISSIDSIILIIVIQILLYNKKDNRKNIVGISLFIYALFSTATHIFNTFTKNAGSIPYIDTIYIVFILTDAIFIYLSVLFLLKTNEKPFKIYHLKPIFTVYVVVVYVNVYFALLNIVFKTALISNIALWIAIIIGAILGGLLIYIFLQLQFVIYRGLADEVFYRNFIVEHPKTTTNRYKAVLYKPATNPEAAMYCMNCGAALMPGANFCRQCGNKVLLKAENKDQE